MPDANIKIKVTTDTSQAEQGLKDTAATTESFGSRFKSTFAGVLAANAVQNLASKVWDFGKQSVAAYSAAEDNAVKYNDAMKRIPGASDAATKSLVDQAKALSKVTTFSAGQTKQGQAVLAGFKLTADQIKTLTPLMQDYAAKTGKDLPSAATDFGKALLGQGRAFKAIGLNLKDTGTESGNFAQLVDGLNGKVGGLAEQMGDTAAGKMTIMQNQVKALQVGLGQALMPAILKVINVLMPLVGWISQNTSWLVPMVGAVIALVGALKLWAMVQAALNIVMAANPLGLIVLAVAALGVAIFVLVKNWDTVWKTILGIIQGVWNWIKANWPLLLAILTGPIGLAVALIVTYWDQIKGAGLAVFNWIKANWPLLVAILTGPIGIAVLAIQRNWDTIRSSVASAISAVVAVFARLPGQIAGALSGLFNIITAPFRDAYDWVVDKFDALKGVVTGAVNTAKGLYNGFARTWNGVQVGVPGVKILGKEVVPGFTFGLPDLPIIPMAEGGYFNRATLGVIGEAGGEYALPEGRLAALLAAAARGGRGGPAVNVENATFTSDIDVEEFSRHVAWTIRTQGV